MPKKPKVINRDVTRKAKRKGRRLLADVGWIVRERTLLGQRLGEVIEVHDDHYLIRWAGNGTAARLFGEVECVPPWEA